MPKDTTQRVVAVNITVTLPKDANHTDQVIAETLQVKSIYKEIKVLGVSAIEE